MTVTLGGKPVERMGFGAMQLPGPGVFGPPRDRDTALAVLRRAVELGVNHIDTAQFYGPDVANELIHAALHPYPSGLVFVSKVGAKRDKTGAWLAAQTPPELRSGVEDNLRSLEVGRVDVVNLRIHPDAPTGLFDDQVAEMVAMRSEGMIGGVGLSTVSDAQLRRALESTEVACVQNAYNLVDRSGEDVLDTCTSLGVPYVPYFPLGSAFGMPNTPLTHPGVVAAAERLHATPAQVALAWLLVHSPLILLIPGTSSVGHLEENVAAASLTLDSQALDDLG